MRLQLRLLVVMVVALLAMAGILVVQHRLNLDGSNKVLASELDQRQAYFGSVLSTDQEPLMTLARDYSFWDDMVTFAQTRDIQFARDNIDTSLTTFNVDAAWVYGTDGTVIYSSQADPINPIASRALPPAFISQLQKNKFAHFYQDDDGTFIEVRAATIVPSNDPTHAQRAAGFWIVARRIDPAYLKNLSSLSQSTTTLLAASAAKPQEYKGDNVNFTTPLTDWNGNTVRLLATTYNIPVITDLNSSYQAQLTQIAILGTVLVALVTAVIWIWVLRPVQRVVLSIAKRKPSLLDGLSRSRTEFGRLARTVQQFFEQRDKLAEAAVRRADLEQMNKEKTAFLSIAAHELKGPIGIINMIAGDLPVSAPKMTPVQLNEELETVTQQGTKMATIINDLQLASQGDSNTKLEYHPEVVDFDRFLQREVDANQLITDQKIHLSGATGRKIFADPIRLSQVVSNLLRNAAKYSPGTDDIEVVMATGDGVVTMAITDHGIGIPVADQKKIFHRFYRASNATQHFQGLGIGLSICWQNVTEFGGTITVQSELHKGSTFTVTLKSLE